MHIEGPMGPRHASLTSDAPQKVCSLDHLHHEEGGGLEKSSGYQGQFIANEFGRQAPNMAWDDRLHHEGKFAWCVSRTSILRTLFVFTFVVYQECSRVTCSYTDAGRAHVPL